MDERLRNIDPKMVELIRSEIMDNRSAMTWDDIAGLEFAKSTIQVVEHEIKINVKATLLRVFICFISKITDQISKKSNTDDYTRTCQADFILI